MGRWFLNFSFEGRARRSHIWANWAIWLGVGVVSVGLYFGLIAASHTATEEPSAIVTAVGALGLFAIWALSFVDHLATTWRRAHDTGRTGWIWLLLFVPLVQLLPLYWLLIEDSQQGPNKYGPPVKMFYEPPSPQVQQTA